MDDQEIIDDIIGNKCQEAFLNHAKDGVLFYGVVSRNYAISNVDSYEFPVDTNNKELSDGVTFNKSELITKLEKHIKLAIQNKTIVKFSIMPEGTP